ncbi:MAG: hypothetical protein HeimC3_04500 [Candidatus Heimdallarchaeota archaeon LC_3]|nr:MAG: hypothetical protein HeimC3_04500 [Candidatus Heimdallarchaeota archaeon LC_3]
MSENRINDKPSIVDEILDKKNNFERNQKIIFVFSIIIFLITLSHVIMDVFFH